MKKLDKWERIQLVRSLGLNTEESILVDRKFEELPQAKKDFIYSNDMFSVRTFNENELGMHPHFPVITRAAFTHMYWQWLNVGLKLIVAKCIDPNGAELVGCAYKKGKSFTIEVAFGPYTVRRVTHEGTIDKTFTTGFLSPKTGDVRIDYAVKEMRRIPFEEAIIEFSWYRMPVGTKSENLIFWEITGAKEKGLLENG